LIQYDVWGPRHGDRRAFKTLEAQTSSKRHADGSLELELQSTEWLVRAPRVRMSRGGGALVRICDARSVDDPLRRHTSSLRWTATGSMTKSCGAGFLRCAVARLSEIRARIAFPGHDEIHRVAGFEPHWDPGRGQGSCPGGAQHRGFSMSGPLRFCFAACLVVAGLSTSPAFSNPFADLFNTPLGQASATAPAPAAEECLPSRRPMASTGSIVSTATANAGSTPPRGPRL